MFTSLEERLKEHNINFGEASVMLPYKIGWLQKWIMTIGALAGGMILLSAFITLKEKYRYGITIDSFAVEEDTGRELCPDCFRKTSEEREYL